MVLPHHPEVRMDCVCVEYTRRRREHTSTAWRQGLVAVARRLYLSNLGDLWLYG